jgi:hypothetical protein
MADTDWTELSNSLPASTVARGVTAGTGKPHSTVALTNNFVYGWNSLLATEGAHGLYCNRTSFNPLQSDGGNATGGSIRAALKRGVSGGVTQVGSSPMLFFNLKGGSAFPQAAPSVDDMAYCLGLTDEDPHRIVLAKRIPKQGLSIVDAADKSILAISSLSFKPDTWVHLRLDCIFNQNGDVVLKTFYNDLDNLTHFIDAPSWQNIPGMSDYIDDALGVNTGSLPLKGGFAGFAFASRDIQKRAYIDHVEILRQKTA